MARAMNSCPILLKILAGLRGDSRLWDIGCGCGMLELALEDAGWKGPLIGTDIHKPCIRWAQNHISNRIPSFEFIHADVLNDAYWPRGRLTVQEWRDSFDQGDFDVVIAKSLFTHMLPEETDVYISAQ